MMKFKFPELPRPRLKPSFDETVGKFHIRRNPGRFALSTTNGNFGFYRMDPEAVKTVLDYTARFLKRNGNTSYLIGYRRAYIVIEAGKAKKSQ